MTIAMGFRPAFSARVVGMTSSASAYAWKQYASMPFNDWAYWKRRRETWISGEPPPQISALRRKRLIYAMLIRNSAVIPLLDDATYDTKGIVQTTFALFDDEIVGAHRENADSSTPVLDTSNFDDLRPGL